MSSIPRHTLPSSLTPCQHGMGTLKLQCKTLSEMGFLGLYSLLKCLQGKKSLPSTNRSFRDETSL